MTLLLTGRSGSIGQYLRTDFELNFRNFQVSKPFSGSHPPIRKSTLIHMAAITNIQEVQRNSSESFKVNVSSTIDLFRSFAASGGKRFVFASTGHVYGRTMQGCYSTETDPVNPLSLYAEQKVLAEQHLLDEAKNRDIELVILRIFSVFGLGMKDHFLAGRIESALNNKHPSLRITNSDDVRDFSSPKQIAESIEESVKIPIDGPIILNLCTGKSTTVKDIVRSNFPTIREESFIPGQSETPRLVGNPALQNSLF